MKLENRINAYVQMWIGLTIAVLLRPSWHVIIWGPIVWASLELTIYSIKLLIKKYKGDRK